MSTTLAKPDIEKKWHLIDAKDKTLGRLAVKIANLLRGRNKPIYTPHIDSGDYVIVINAEKIKVTGKKQESKQYMFYSGWRGNEKYIKYDDMQKKNPAFIIENAVKGMLPKNRISRQFMKKLRVFKGEEHTHKAQNPVPFNG